MKVRVTWTTTKEHEAIFDVKNVGNFERRLGETENELLAEVERDDSTLAAVARREVTWAEEVLPGEEVGEAPIFLAWFL